MLSTQFDMGGNKYQVEEMSTFFILIEIELTY